MDTLDIIIKLEKHLDDRSLMNLSETSKYYLYIINNKNLWKQKCKRLTDKLYCDGSLVDIEKLDPETDWKKLYIKFCPVYVKPIVTKKYHLEYISHPSGCHITRLSSGGDSLVIGTSFTIDNGNEYYIIDVKDNHVFMVDLLCDKKDKYYLKSSPHKYKITKSKEYWNFGDEYYNIFMYIKGTGSIKIPWKSI